MVYHGKLISPNGQVYFCEHNHRTLTAAITCANSSRTRQMAEMEWNRAAIRAAQAAELAKQRAEQRAAAQARRIAAQEAAAARRAADRAAAENAKAAKRAAKLAAMPPQRAWKRMTPEERLLKIAEAELGFYGEIISPEAKAAYDNRAAKRAATAGPETPAAPPQTAASPKEQAPGADAPAYVRALDLSLSPMERARAKDQAAADPEQWAKYVAALRARRAEDDHASLGAGTSGRNTAPVRGTRPIRPVSSSAPAPSQPVPIKPAPPHRTPEAATGDVHGRYRPGPAAGAQSRLIDAADHAEANVGGRRDPAGSKPAAGSRSGFGGDGLFVVGLDITPGVYRTPGPAPGGNGYIALLRSTRTSDIMDNLTVRGPATITVGPGVKAVHVQRCQPWHRLGDNLDAVIAAATEPRSTTSRDS